MLLDSLHNIFHHFADTDGLNKAKEKKRLNLTEWLNMMKDLELYDAHFTSRDATVVFVLSRMRVIDEQVATPFKRWRIYLLRTGTRRVMPRRGDEGPADG